MRSRTEGFYVTNRATEILPYAVEYYGVEMARFDSYADCILHIAHWAVDAESLVHALNEELVQRDWATIAACVEARDREALVARQRRS